MCVASWLTCIASWLACAVHAAAAEMKAPRLKAIDSETSLVVRLFPGPELHGPVSHYYVIIVPEQHADRDPNNFSRYEVRFPLINFNITKF